METKLEYLRGQVLDALKTRATKEHPVTTKELREQCNTSPRELKRIITDLRQDYPILSRETNGGGYWISDNEADIQNFVLSLTKKVLHYQGTINIMNQHIANYKNVPVID